MGSKPTTALCTEITSSWIGATTALYTHAIVNLYLHYSLPSNEIFIILVADRLVSVQQNLEVSSVVKATDFSLTSGRFEPRSTHFGFSNYVLSLSPTPMRFKVK